MNELDQKEIDRLWACLPECWLLPRHQRDCPCQRRDGTWLIDGPVPFITFKHGWGGFAERRTYHDVEGEY